MKFKEPKHGTQIVEFGIKKVEGEFRLVGKDSENNFYLFKKYAFANDYESAKERLNTIKRLTKKNKYIYLNSGTKINYFPYSTSEATANWDCANDQWYYIKDILN